ncbi:hypothetical protein RSOLAG22IIIB_09851 [Rhizoctonia solani]|uniref:Uncharacterized protein n=1 Tax=Rhizoctonia solani TaxID=456999 RepID=A0A0K6FZU3_9AGAM|nr:hypothetical protein RSOLAG22IIIB_09851 [Rhizoctonia solani]
MLLNPRFPAKESEGYSFHYNNTLYQTSRPGSSASFKFNGTAAWYISNTHPHHGVANITLDGTLSSLAHSDRKVRLSQQILWKSQKLPYGEHTVIVTHSGNTGEYVALDCFMYLPGETLKKSSSSTGAVIGGVIGGVALITICVAGWIFVRRRRTAELQSNPDLHGFEDAPVLTQNNGSLQPATVPPAWGYVTTPYVSEENRNSSTSPHHHAEHRLRKGELVQARPPVSSIITSSAPTTLSNEDLASRAGYTDQPESHNRETDLDPPPYVRV